MPFCNVSTYQNDVDAANNNGIQIFYRTYGCGPVKVLLIIGLAGTHDSWVPQIKGLAGTVTPNDDESPCGDQSNESGATIGVEVCAFDNRGMGRSSVPAKKSEYTTNIMAKDAIAVMDHLGWGKAHVFGHSMGAMIACKLAALAPDRVSSLALLNVTGGGYECIPKEVGGCDYFIWYDPQICERSKQIIPGLLRNVSGLEQDIKNYVDRIKNLEIQIQNLEMQKQNWETLKPNLDIQMKNLELKMKNLSSKEGSWSRWVWGFVCGIVVCFFLK